MENFRRCRICITESSEMISIFGDDALWKKITSFANVQIDEGDDLPQQICTHCARNVINACAFKEKCEEADRFFRVSTTGQIDVDPAGYSTEAQSHDEADHLHLIPEIEIITPNDDDKTEESGGYQCSICFDFFAMKSTLNHHIKSKHPDACPSYECFECKKSYISKRFLDKHVRRGRCNIKPQNQSRVVQCTECHATFPSGHHLGWHKRAGNCPSIKGDKPVIPTPLDPDETDSEAENLNESFIADKEITPKSRTLTRNYGKTWDNGKRKGRTRMKLDKNKIELAKRLMAEDATTTRLAQELGISRTYAWKLRKSLDVSLKILPSPNKSNNVEPPDVPIHSVQRQQSVITFNNNNKNEDCKDNIKKEIIEQCLETKLDIENGQTKVKEEEDSEDDGEKTKSADESHENGQSHFQDVEESEEDDNRSDEDDGEETESADETGSVMQYPVASCSNSSFSLGSGVDVFPSDSIVQNVASKTDPQGPPYRRKPRKPNVFLTQEMYEQAKILVANRATTMEVARNLNISQMSAWKLRDNIIKGIPMTFKPPPNPRLKDSLPKLNMPQNVKMRTGSRQERDFQVKKEILTMIREDNNIQYWKISERLAEKGLYLSASSVCQKLKAMGFHRRWKPSDALRQGNPMKFMSSGEDYIS